MLIIQSGRLILLSVIDSSDPRIWVASKQKSHLEGAPDGLISELAGSSCFNKAASPCAVCPAEQLAQVCLDFSEGAADAVCYRLHAADQSNSDKCCKKCVFDCSCTRLTLSEAANQSFHDNSPKLGTVNGSILTQVMHRMISGCDKGDNALKVLTRS